jgi:hypothetical protein
MLTLQQMIDGVLAGAEGQALSKIAQAAEEGADMSADEQATEGEGKAPPRTKREAERQADKEEKAQGGGQDNSESEDTDQERVEKMASAVEEVVRVLLTDGSNMPVGRVVTAEDGVPMQNALQTDDNKTPETETANFGEATAKIPTNPPQEKVQAPEKGTSAMATDEEKRAIPAPAEKIGSFADVLAQNPKSPELKGAFSRYQKATGKDPKTMSFADIRDYTNKERAAKAKTGSLQDYAARLLKSAMDPSSPAASVSGAKSDALPEDRPLNAPLAAGAETQRAMLASNEAAMNLTKRKAKAQPKQDLAALLSERAMARSTDKALDQTLGAQQVDQAGAKIASARKLKIAAARALITKIAAEGCTCEEEGLEKGQCRFCRVASRLEAKEGSSCASEKKAQMGDVPAASNIPPSVQSSASPAAGGMPPQM